MTKNRVTEILGSEKPIIQAPMDWITDAKLVAAVNAAGGFGFLAPNAGQTTNAKSPAEAVSRMKDEIEQTKALTNRPFGLCVLPGDPQTDQFTAPMVDLAIEEGVKAIAYVGDRLIPELFAKIKDNGLILIYRALNNPSVEQFKTAAAMGADMVVVTGFDHGGDLPYKSISTLELIPQVVDAVDIPVLADGGIADRRTVNAVFALGAEGVYCGTVFIASNECPANKTIKNFIVSNNADSLVLFRGAPSPYYRSIPTTLALKLQQMSRQGAANEEIGKLMRGAVRNALVDGDMENGLATLGNGISNIHAIRPVKEIIDDLTHDIA